MRVLQSKYPAGHQGEQRPERNLVFPFSLPPTPSLPAPQIINAEVEELEVAVVGYRSGDKQQ